MSDEKDPLQVDRTVVAKVLGQSVNNVHKMVTRGMPNVRRGVYSLPECVQWYIEDLKMRGAIDPEEAEMVVQERTLLYRAQRQGKELENEIAAKRQIPVEFLHERAMDLSAELVGGLDTLAARAAPECIGLSDETTALATLERHVREVRNAISERLEGMGKDAVSGSHANASGAGS